MAKKNLKNSAKKAPKKALAAKPAKPAKPAPKAAAKPAPKAARPEPKPARPDPKSSRPPAKPEPAPAKEMTKGKPGSLFVAPIPPRSRLAAREPVAAEDLKAKLGALATAINQIKAVKRSIQRSFWEVGLILVDIRDKKLFVAKGYSSFEAFLEREIELGKNVSLKLARAVQIFQKEPAVAAGLERVILAVAAFDGELEPREGTPQGPPTPTSAGSTRSPIPFHKQ